MSRTFRAVDLFCGGGFATEALMFVVKELEIPLSNVHVLGINHWQTAIDTHRSNHPNVVHLCESIENVNPSQKVFRDKSTGREFRNTGRFDLLLAGPECIFHSPARGGRPIDDQRRSTAWRVVDWLTANYIDNVLIENVPAFGKWAPLGANNRPLKNRAGEVFNAYIGAIKALGYHVQTKVICSADNGDPQTRDRLWIMARKKSLRFQIQWPEPTHSEHGGTTLLRTTKKWRSAREIIDWTIPSRSIFDPTRRPIAHKTLLRIMAGLERFGGKELEPFLVILRNNADARSVDKPLPTIAASGGHIGLVEMTMKGGEYRGNVLTDSPITPEPFILPLTHGSDRSRRERSVDAPLPTVTGAHRGDLAICEPMVIAQGQGGVARPVGQPVPTIATKGAHQLIEPFLIPHYGERPGQTPRVHSLGEPLPTVPATGGGKFEIAQPYLIRYNGEKGDGAHVHSLDAPIGTLPTENRFGLVQPFLAAYYGTQNISPVSAPVPTVTTKDRFALVMPVVNGRALDIYLRMLQPRELARAFSVGDHYQFTGTKGDTVKQIGNGWPRRTAVALIRSLLKDYAQVKPGRRLEATA